MFKDKELHAGLALLINRFADFCIANNQSTKNISTNFQYIGDQLVAFEGKLTDIQQLQDKLDNQSYTLIAVVDERNKYQRLLEDTQNELVEVGAQLSDEKLYGDQMQERIKALEQSLNEALKAQDAWKETYESENQLCLGLAKERDLLRTELESLRHKLVMFQAESSLVTAPAPAPAQPVGFNIQELANELSKYLTAPAVVEDTGLPTTGVSHADNVQKFFSGTSGTGMGQDYGSNLMLSSGTTYSTASSGDTAGGNSLGVAASVLQPRSYIPSPSTSEPDAILADNILAADPEVMARIPKTPGPVLLPSQAQYAYQVAELVADGAQYLPPVPTVPTQG